MRLLLVTNDYPPRLGGIQKYLADLVEHFPGPVRVLAPGREAVPADPLVVRAGPSYLWPTTATRRWVLRQIGEFGPRVVLFGAPHPLAVLGPGLLAETGIPYGVIAYGADLLVPSAVPVARSLVARPLRRASVVFALSRFILGAAERISGRSVDYLGCGIDSEKFHPPNGRLDGPPGGERGSKVIGSVGRFVPRKGQDRLLRAVAELRRSGLQVEVLLVGGGRMEGRLRKLAGKLKVPVRFEVKVPWDRLPSLYRQMDVFALPVRSRWFGLEAEGLGIVYLEAAASGLPVVAGASGGAPETVVPGVTGFVAHGPAHLAEALEMLLRNPEGAHRMGEEGRNQAEAQFSWEAVMERLQAGLELAVRRVAE
ncbi:MAG: glycosyltransferase family 4 protein [Actinomycetota bacterium]|nr:glycosyltransferase family 4 protein [Actinomycetota bacterium]